MWFILGAVFLGLLATYLFVDVEQRKQTAEMEAVKAQAVHNDAQTVADSIIISGWEDVGDYVGYLSQISGFYRRHVDLYQTEHETYSRQLSEWQDYLADARKAGKTVYFSDWKTLEGLVKSGADQMRQIANNGSRN